VDVYYESHGDGPALVLCHGSGGNHAIWWQQVPHFRDSHRVIAIDFPGFGRSVAPPDAWDAHTYPKVILAVLDDAEIERAVLVGQSLGCAPSLALAIAHPERVAGVVLAHSLGGISDEEVLSLVRADRAEADRLPVLDRLLTRRFQEQEPERVFLFQQLGTFNGATSQGMKNSRTWPTTLADVRDAIAAGVFVCFLEGTADAVTSARSYQRLRELLPEAHVETVEGGPHSLYWEQPEVFNAALERILERAQQAA
jgi:pimeloyl-ACP methyl ester carboxylesterase